MHHDIAIIGGGIIGSSIAYFLARSGRAGSVTVIEADASYRLAATPTGAGGVRQLFSCPENIQMSRDSLRFYKHFATTMAVDGQPAAIDFTDCGYLFVVGEAGRRQLEANYERQIAEGVPAQLLSRAALADRFPSLGVDDIAAGCLSPTDGTLTTRLALAGFRRKAEDMGVAYREDRVVDVTVDRNLARSITLASGTSVAADVVINAAGAWAHEVAAMVGMPLPVAPMCRVKHAWSSPVALEPLPLVKDESGLFIRQQGTHYVGGVPSWEITPGFFHDDDNRALRQYFDGYFERAVRPRLGVRFPAFRAASASHRWVGHYAQNTLDGNMILGPWTNGVQNFYVACGFSGHGVMHAPAVGRAMAELVLEGASTTIDLARLTYQRVEDDEPYPELGII